MDSSASEYVIEAVQQPAGVVPTLQSRKQQFVRDAIWDAATDLFAEKGFDETTVDDIAQAARVSRRSLFRYFSSKSDLMAHGMVSYGAELTDAIDACPETYSLFEVFRETVVKVAQRSAAHPRTRKIMHIVTKYPAARAAELSRLHEVQDRVAAAFARRCGKGAKEDLAPTLLAGLTLQVLGVTFRSWYGEPERDISAAAHQAFATLRHLVCENGRSHKPTHSKRSEPNSKRRGN
jgi:AcrR family transcriptional regulator